MPENSLLKIRIATIEDSKLIYEFILKIAEYEKLISSVTATEEIIKNSLFSKNSHAQCIIAEYNQKPAAYAIFFFNFSTFTGKQGLYLEDLFVLPELRGLGIGKAILKHLSKFAIETECARFEWVVLDWNKSAIDFYNSIGAKSMDEWTVYRLNEVELRAFASS